MVNKPAPPPSNPPIISAPDTSRVEPDPSTRAAPEEPGESPSEAKLVAATRPPLATVRLPVPASPTRKSPLRFQVEPAPLTFAVPTEPANVPSSAYVLETTPPPRILSV